MTEEQEEVMVFRDPSPDQRGGFSWPAARNPGLYMELVFSDASSGEGAQPIRLTSEDLQEAYQDAEGHWARGLHSDAVGYQIQDEYRAAKAEVRKKPALWPQCTTKERSE